MVEFADYNPLANAKMFDMGSLASGLLIFFIVVIILSAIGLIIFTRVNKKNFYIKIKVFRNVGNRPTQIAEFRAREVPMGLAGDKLWRVAPNSALQMPFKIVKWLAVGKLQTAPNEFWYWIRKDGEWINWLPPDLDAESEKMKVTFVQEDMRLQRLAIDRLLEQRLMNKTFWEKWGNTIMTMVFFLIIAVCMVIIFYQWGKLLEKMTPLVSMITQALGVVEKTCPAFMNVTSGGGTSGLIPVV